MKGKHEKFIENIQDDLEVLMNLGENKCYKIIPEVDAL